MIAAAVWKAENLAQIKPMLSGQAAPVQYRWWIDGDAAE